MTGMQTTPRTAQTSPKRRFRPSWDPTDTVDEVISILKNVAPATVWRTHRLFTVVACLSILPRFVAAMGFKPALLIQDSFSYLREGTNLGPGELRPAGYPMMLRVLEPFHSLLLVTTVQHAMGIAIGILIYSILHSRGLPAWAATLAAVPTLFDARQIWLESSILPDTLFTLVLMIAVAILIMRPKLGILSAVIVGVLVAYASVIRGNGAPVIVIVVAFLLVRRVGWRVIVACVVAFAVPLLGYVMWFYSSYGQFNITNSSGLFLWSRTMSFANCAIIKPPADLLPLCPQNQPGYQAGPTPAWSADAVVNQRTPADYLWDPGVWYEHDAHPGINAYNNKLGMEFAERAIEAQPLAYLKTVGEGVMLTFLSTDRSTNYLADHFTATAHIPTLAPYMKYYEDRYAHTVDNTHPHQPWAYLIFWYQMPVWFPGWIFLAVFVFGLGALIRRWRGWGVYAALAWGVGIVNLVVPIAAHELDYRYALSSVPFACLALGLALNKKPVPGQLEPDTAQPAPAQPDTAPADLG